MPDELVRGVAEHVDERMTDRREAARCQPIGVLPRVVVERCQHDVERFEDAVLEIEAAIREDVDFDAVEDGHPRKALAQRVDLVALLADIVAGERPRRGSA